MIGHSLGRMGSRICNGNKLKAISFMIEFMIWGFRYVIKSGSVKVFFDFLNDNVEEPLSQEGVAPTAPAQNAGAHTILCTRHPGDFVGSQLSMLDSFTGGESKLNTLSAKAGQAGAVLFRLSLASLAEAVQADASLRQQFVQAIIQHLQKVTMHTMLNYFGFQGNLLRVYVNHTLCNMAPGVRKPHIEMWFASQHPNEYVPGAGCKTRLHTPKAVTYHEQSQIIIMSINHDRSQQIKDL